MPDELILYTNPMSRGRVVRWMLEEVGAAYRTELLAYGITMKSADYLRIAPMGKVPAIQHGDVVVTETAAICAYLADAFPEAGLAPTGPLRGTYYRWLFFAAGPVEAAVLNKTLGVAVPPGREGMAGYGSYDATMNELERAVSDGDYLVGGRFSTADIYVGSQIGFGLTFGTMERRPAFESYWTRISARPAHARAAAIDDALIAQMAPSH